MAEKIKKRRFVSPSSLGSDTNSTSGVIIDAAGVGAGVSNSRRPLRTTASMPDISRLTNSIDGRVPSSNYQFEPSSNINDNDDDDDADNNNININNNDDDIVIDHFSNHQSTNNTNNNNNIDMQLLSLPDRVHQQLSMTTTSTFIEAPFLFARNPVSDKLVTPPASFKASKLKTAFKNPISFAVNFQHNNIFQ